MTDAHYKYRHSHTSPTVGWANFWGNRWICCVCDCKKQSQKLKCPSDLLIGQRTANHEATWHWLTNKPSAEMVNSTNLLISPGEHPGFGHGGWWRNTKWVFPWTINWSDHMDALYNKGQGLRRKLFPWAAPTASGWYGGSVGRSLTAPPSSDCV